MTIQKVMTLEIYCFIHQQQIAVFKRCMFECVKALRATVGA